MNARALRGTFSIEPGSNVDELSAGGLAAAFSRGRGLILGATLLGGGAALAYATIATPRFQAQSEVLVENQENYYTSAAPEGGRPDNSASFDAEAINSQIQLLTSRDLAQQAIDQLKLVDDPEFNRESGALAALAHPLRALGLYPADKTSAENLALANFAERLTVMSPTKSRVLQIDFLSRDPELAARVANLVAELYIDVKAKAKRDDAGAAARALTPLITALEARVADADAKVEAFRASAGLYESSENVTAPTLQYGEIAKKLAEARARQSAAAARADTLRRLLAENRLVDASDIANNELVRQIATQRVALRARLAGQSRIYLSAHPIIRELQAQNDEIDRQLRSALEQAARGLDNEAKTSATEVANLTALLESQKDAVGAASADAARLRELQRDAQVLRDQLTSLSAKYQAALARQAAEAAPADARIISRALAPSQPVFPKKLPLTLFGALAGLFFSAFLIAARALSGAPREPAVPAPPTAVDPATTPTPDQGHDQAGWKDAAPEPQGEVAETVEPFADPSTVADADPSRPDQPIDLPRLSPHQTSARDDIAARKAARAAQPVEAPPLFPAAPFPASSESIAEPVPSTAARLASPAPDDDIAAALEPNENAPVEAIDHIPEPAPTVQEPPEPPLAARLLPAEEPPGSVAVSPGMAARIATAGGADARRGAKMGAKILVASAPDSMDARAGLTLARALSNDGRAILVQLDPADPALSAALHPIAHSLASPGLAQLLSGEASFGDIIHRDGASRLHLIRAGGPVANLAGDLDLVLDALRATYDYVILASGPSAEALRLAPEADLTMVFAEDDASRDRLAEDFAAARQLLRARRDAFGELVEAV